MIIAQKQNTKNRGTQIVKHIKNRTKITKVCVGSSKQTKPNTGIVQLELVVVPKGEIR